MWDQQKKKTRTTKFEEEKKKKRKHEMFHILIACRVFLSKDFSV